MTHASLILLLILAIVLSPVYARAQQNTQTTDTALKAKALNLLESAAGQVRSLQSPENRARLGANIADSLWDHDEKRARALFGLVEEDIRLGLANRDLRDSRDSHTLKVFLKLRVETVERIAKHDAELALAFLKATQFISDQPLPKHFTESERGLEMRLAKLIASTSPDLAVKLARQSLDQGFSDDLLPLLRQLNRKSKEQGLILYKEVVQKLREADLAGDFETMRFAHSLAYTFKPSIPTDTTFRELIGILVTRSLENGCGNRSTVHDYRRAEFCRLFASLKPQMERIDPRAAQLERLPDDAVDNDVPPETVHEYFDLLEAGTFNDLLAFADKYPNVRDDILWHAVVKAGESGDFEEARKIANHVSEPNRRQSILSNIENRQKWNSADSKRLAEMQSRLERIELAEHRVQVLLSYAARFSANDRTAALRLLKQASDIADTMKPGREQTETHLALAVVYSSLKSERGFSIMESLMPKLNELVEAAIKLDGFETGYMRDGEWNMSANGSVGVILTRLSENAGKFAWHDFDRAVNLAAQFERAEIRLMGQVKLAQAILAGPLKPLQPGYGPDF